MLETMAQACGYLAVVKNRFEKMAYLLGVDAARFRQYVQPGDLMRVKVKEMHEGSGYSVFSAGIYVNDVLTSSAEIRLKIASFPNAVLRNTMLQRLSAAGLTKENAQHEILN